MEYQLKRQCLEMLHAQSPREFLRIGVEFVHSLDFHTVAATVVTDHGSTLTQFQSLTNASPEYLPAFENMESAKLDPVSQHCKKFSSPVVWTQDLYTSSGRTDLWEEQAAFGYRSGISMAFHLPRGRHFMFGMDSGRLSCAPQRELQTLLLDFREFASYAQAAAFDLCLPYCSEASERPLHAGELDALRWSMDGLTDWEVGEAMSISEREATLRLQRATKKLGCKTKYEAALRAIKLGLVYCD